MKTSISPGAGNIRIALLNYDPNVPLEHVREVFNDYFIKERETPLERNLACISPIYKNVLIVMKKLSTIL